MTGPYWASSIFGPIEPKPEHVNHRGYVLCHACSRGLHADHTPPCDCDLEESP